LNGRDKDGKELCFCGRNHTLRRCFYVKEGKKPTWWKPKDAILKKFDNKMKSDPRFRAEVDRIREEVGDQEEMPTRS